VRVRPKPGDHHYYDLAQVRGQQEMNRFADVVIDGSSLTDGNNMVSRSSSTTISATSRATSVPVWPIATRR